MSGDDFVTARQLCKHFGLIGRDGNPTCTWRRWVKSGLLAEPELVRGINVWRYAQMIECEERLRLKPSRSIPAEAIGREKAHSTKSEFLEMQIEAAGALAKIGAIRVAEVIKRYAPSDRLLDVPTNARRALIHDLKRLA